ncbi:NADH-quinone oxidoreductase subunit A [Mycoplasmopsis arginini]
MIHQSHAYHIVKPSPWPLAGALSALLTTSGLAVWFHFYSTTLLTLGLLTITLTLHQWWRDIVRESTYQGHHTTPVQKNLRYGIVLFIISEIFFFTGFFWAFYHSSLAPTPHLGGHWPPTGITPLNPLEVPLLNTSVLLASGVTITWAHHSLINNNRKQTTQALLITILLGIYFTLLQISEYFEAPFTISDGIYGSTFFIATGFHGLHVIIGSTFLLICLIRQLLYHFTPNHHFGFEAATWYWHFVDVVWLLLYISIYWWGSYSFSITSTIDFQSISFDSIQKGVINLVLALTINTLLTSLLIIIMFWLPQLNPYAEKTNPYECGFDPLNPARIPFSIKFFLVAITFLLFDLEIALLLSLPWALQTTNLLTIIKSSITLIIILALSLAYEWSQKGLDWAELVSSLNKTNDFDSLDYDHHTNQMSPIFINIILAFIISLLGMLVYRSHLIASLLCLEGIIISLFIMIALIASNTHSSLTNIIPITLLVFAACETAVGLALLVSISNTYGLDYIHNLSLLQC